MIKIWKFEIHLDVSSNYYLIWSENLRTTICFNSTNFSFPSMIYLFFFFLSRKTFGYTRIQRGDEVNRVIQREIFVIQQN